MLKTSYLVNHSEKNLKPINLKCNQFRLIGNQQISNDLELPEGFIVGKAIGGGDCFFDSVAQGLRQLKPDMEFTVKSLRQVCKRLALNDQRLKDLVITDARGFFDDTVVLPCSSINNNELWDIYLASIEYTAEDIERMRIENPHLYKSLTNLKYGSTLQAPIWGRLEIEGVMICREYNLKLHIIEGNQWHATDKQQDPFLHQLINGLGSRSVGTRNKVDYNDDSVLHIANKSGTHFEPILRKKVQQMSPLSGLIQNQSEPNELPCVNIIGMWKSTKAANNTLLISKIQREFTDIIENYNLPEEKKLSELKSFFQVYPGLNVNFYVNEHNDTPLHIAVYMGESKIIKLLLKVKAQVNALNKEGKTSIDIAEDNNRKDIAKILQPLVLHKGIDVPGDGNCLFWSVALAYLTPVKFDDYTFCERFKKLFGEGCDVQVTQRLMQGNVGIYKDNTLRELVTEVFRREVVDEMCLNQKKLKNKINMEDFLESRSGNYFIKGTFKEGFESKFGAKKINQYNIDASKFQPNFFDEDAVKEICTELDKVAEKDRKKVQEFLFETYLECMGMPEAWGGRHEINVMSKLLNTTIIVSQKNSEDYIYNEGKRHCNKIHLSYKEGQHYQFYQVEYSNLMKFVLSFVQVFETKLAAYDVLGNMLRQEKRMLPLEIKNGKFVRGIFGFSAYTGSRITSNVRASLKVGNVTKVTKSFISLSDLIETFNEYKLGFRKVLVDAACDIFQSFEMQFDEIGLNQVSKVANDIIDKIIEYYIQKEYERKLNDIVIAEALVSDKYLQEIPDRIVQYGEKNYSLKGLYENIAIAKEGFAYYKKNNEDSQYGYRRSFMGEKPEITHTKTKTTNAEFESYEYTLDPQDFKKTVEYIFYIVNKEIQAPSTKIIEGVIVKIKSHIEQEVSFLSDYILSYSEKCKQSFNVHMNSFKETERLSESEKARNSRSQLDRAKKNSEIISVMKENLKTIPSSCYNLQIKEIFVDHAEAVSQDYNNLFESQCDDTIKSGSLWSRVKALSSLFGKMNFKDVCAPVEEFTGRQEQIEDIYKKLQEGIVVIIGPSGIGKTQLARKFVEENREVYLHAYEVNTQDMLSIESSFTSFVRDKLAMSMEEEGNKGRKKCLFLFEGVQKENIEKILKIRGERGGFDCLFTSSDQGYKDIAEVALDNLEDKQAGQLVKKILEIADKSQDEQIEALVRKLKGFPLAIKLAVACIKNKKSSVLGKAFGIFEYLTQYEEFDQILPRNTRQNEYDRVLQITSLISTKAIQEVNFRKEVLEVLSAMAYFGSDQIDPNLFLAWIEDEDELYSVFELLERYSIIHAEEGDNYKVYVMHALVKKAVRLQLDIDEEKQTLSRVIELISGTERSFYVDVGHLLSVFHHSQGYESLVAENCYLVHMVLSALNALCEYKKAFAFWSEASKVLIATNRDLAMARYEIANAMTALGKYDLALQILLDLKRQDALSNTFPLLNLDKEIIFIHFKQKRYEEALSYVKSDNFLLIKSLDEKDQCYLGNYLNIVNTVAKIFVMQERYTDAFTILHYERELRDEVFLKRGDFGLCNDPYLCPSDMYELYNLDAKYTYALVCFFTSQDRKKITIEEGALPHKEDLPRELSIPALLKQLQDVLKNQEGSQYLQPAPYSVERKIRKALQRKAKEKTLESFEAVLQLQREYGFSENHPKVLSVKFYIALLYSCLDDREKALQELKQLQELQEKVIGVNHPDTLATVDAIQGLFTRGGDRSTYLRNEMEKRESLLQLEKSDLNISGVLILKKIYVKGNSSDDPSVNASSSRELLPGNKRRSLETENTQAKRRKIDNQQQVNSCLDSVNIDLSYQRDAMVNLSLNLSH